MFYDTYTDLELLIYVMWAEARGEGPLGMRAVGHVIKNRIGFPGFPKTLRTVLTQQNAFSCLLPNDREFGTQPDTDDPQFAFCQETAPNILNGTDADNTNGAHFYMNSATATSPWFLNHIVDDKVNHPLLAIIGRQNFYR
jgi:N-acetylmuramoyl-L-alanine amidase